MSEAEKMLVTFAMLSYIFYEDIVFFLVRSFHPITFSSVIIKQFILLLIIASTLLMLSMYSTKATAAAWLIAAVILLGIAYKKLNVLGFGNMIFQKIK